MATESQFWTASKTLKVMAEKYTVTSDNRLKWPDVIQMMQDKGDHLGLTPVENYELALKAFGATIWYMTKCLIDQQIMAMARYSVYVPPDVYGDAQLEASRSVANVNRNRHMVLDAITLSNLKVCNSEGSLLSGLDHCCTKFGKR